MLNDKLANRLHQISVNWGLGHNLRCKNIRRNMIPSDNLLRDMCGVAGRAFGDSDCVAFSVAGCLVQPYTVRRNRVWFRFTLRKIER